MFEGVFKKLVEQKKIDCVPRIYTRAPIDKTVLCPRGHRYESNARFSCSRCSVQT